MINFLDFCTEPSVLKVFLFIRIILKLVFIIVPIGLIIMLGIDFFKNVIAKDDSEMKKNLNLALKRLLYVVILFFVPTIVNLVMAVVNDAISNLDVDYVSCIKNIDYIDEYEEVAALREEQEQKELLERIELSKIKEEEERILQIVPSNGNSSSNGNWEVAENYVDYGDITKISGLSKTELIKGLTSEKNWFKNYYEPFIALADTYVSMEQKYGVNLFWLLPHETIESAWGISDVSKICNNLGGLKYSSDQTEFGGSPCYAAGYTSENDGYYAKFSDKSQFVEYVASYLRSDYLSPDGMWYEGVAAVDVLIHYWGNPSLSERQSYVDIVASRADAIIAGLE